MALTQLVGTAVESGAIYPTVSTAVAVAAELNTGWVWAPYVHPTRVISAAPPSVGRAELVYDYGYLVRSNEAAEWASHLPYALGGYYVTIWGYTAYGAAPLWLGVIDTETITPRGNDANSLPNGEQKWGAYSLEHIWDRVQINGSMTDGGWIDRTIPFNRRDMQGLSVLGNRKTDDYPTGSGIYWHSSDGETWSALDALRYLLTHYSPFTVYLGGAYGVLADIVQEWSFEGQSLFDAVNELIDRRRGVGWRLSVYGAGDIETLTTAIYLEVYTQVDQAVGYNGYTLPANAYQDYLVLDENVFRKPRVTANSLCAYDTIRIEGERLGICCSLSATDGTLAAGWTSAQETAYKNVSGDSSTAKDKERATDKYRDVFAKLVVPSNWNFKCGNGENTGTFYETNPTVLPDGTLDYANTSGAWVHGLAAERALPLYTAEYDGHYEPRAPFVVCKDPDSGVWGYVDRQVVEGREGATVEWLANELGFRLGGGGHNHAWAVEDFDPETYETTGSPVYDWRDLIATVFFRADERLAITIRPSNLPWTSTTRTKTIRVPGAELWLIFAGTVTDVTEGALTRQADGSLPRDDRAALQAIAAFAGAYYGQLRRTAEIQIDEITLGHPVGTMIVGGFSSGFYVPVGTVVTSREWEFGDQGQRTTIRTAYEELEVGGLAPAVAGQAASHAVQEQRLRMLEARAAHVPIRIAAGGGGKVVYGETKDDFPTSPVGYKGVTTGDDKRVYECTEIDEEGASVWLCVTHLEDES